MAEIKFREVKPYKCRGCRRTIVLRPCPACTARRQFPGRRGLTGDGLATSVGHQATVRASAAVRMARRDEP